MDSYSLKIGISISKINLLYPNTTFVDLIGSLQVMHERQFLFLNRLPFRFWINDLEYSIFLGTMPRICQNIFEVTKLRIECIMPARGTKGEREVLSSFFLKKKSKIEIPSYATIWRSGSLSPCTSRTSSSSSKPRFTP